MFALRTCANIVSFLLVTKNEIGAERVPVWEASEKCSGLFTPAYRLPHNLAEQKEWLGRPFSPRRRRWRRE